MYKISTPIWDTGYCISEDVWRHRYKLWGKKRKWETELAREREREEGKGGPEENCGTLNLF